MAELSATACVRCGLTVEMPHGLPDGGVIFSSGGNYGSRVWDEMYRTIIVCICDDCLLTVGRNGWVQEVQRPEPGPRTFVPWTPDEATR